jgi:hypothetical protein
MANQDQYLSSRAEALQNVERTITELGGIFQQLATMVAEQGELAVRIDENVDDAVANVAGPVPEPGPLRASLRACHPPRRPPPPPPHPHSHPPRPPAPSSSASPSTSSSTTSSSISSSSSSPAPPPPHRLTACPCV